MYILISPYPMLNTTDLPYSSLAPHPFRTCINSPDMDVIDIQEFRYKLT